MSWPTNPTNGQQTTVAGIVYEYNSISQVWDRVFATVTIPSFTTAVTVSQGSQPNITSVGTMSTLSVTGLTTATGGVKTPNISDVSGTTSIFTKYNSVSGDVGMVGNLFIGTSGIGNVSATNYTGNLITGTQPNITSVGTLANLNVSGTFTNGSAAEVIVNSGAASSSTINYDMLSGATFYHSSVSVGSNWTVNIQNVSTTDARSIIFTIVVVQGATPYIPSALTIDGGSAQTIKWSNGTVPTGKASAVDIFSFALLRTGAAWAQVLGSYTTYS